METLSNGWNSPSTWGTGLQVWWMDIQVKDQQLLLRVRVMGHDIYQQTDDHQQLVHGCYAHVGPALQCPQVSDREIEWDTCKDDVDL